MRKKNISDHLAIKGIKWKFNPPSSPHTGGIWEAAVKSIRHHLNRVLGTLIFTYEEMTTQLIRIEAILNSRPLDGLKSDSNDGLNLTPGHFLIGSPLLSTPETTDPRGARLSALLLSTRCHVLM